MLAATATNSNNMQRQLLPRQRQQLQQQPQQNQTIPTTTRESRSTRQNALNDSHKTTNIDKHSTRRHQHNQQLSPHSSTFCSMVWLSLVDQRSSHPGDFSVVVDDMLEEVSLSLEDGLPGGPRDRQTDGDRKQVCITLGKVRMAHGKVGNNGPEHHTE